MYNSANYKVIDRTEKVVIIRDLGPWDAHPTVTNDAEMVVRAMLPELRGRRLLYFDSEGELAELRIRDGRFAGFGPA